MSLDALYVQQKRTCQQVLTYCCAGRQAKTFSDSKHKTRMASTASASFLLSRGISVFIPSFEAHNQLLKIQYITLTSLMQCLSAWGEGVMSGGNDEAAHFWFSRLGSDRLK